MREKKEREKCNREVVDNSGSMKQSWKGLEGRPYSFKKRDSAKNR